MNVNDALLISATLLGPVLAVQAQKYIERWRDGKTRRDQIFKVLMATRATRLAPQHIEALNLIDIEFPKKEKRFKNVLRAWKAYCSLLHETHPDEPQAWPVFFARRDDLFTDLLSEMGVALGYDFDKTQISKDGYATIYHSDAQGDADVIRKQLAKILTGKAAFPMAVVSFPADQQALDAQAEYFKAIAHHLAQGKPWPVSIISTNGQSSGASPDVA